MPARRASRAPAALAGRQRAVAAAADGGHRIRQARQRRGWTLEQLGDKVGVTGWRVGQIERGEGAGAPMELWFALAAALELALRVELGRDPAEDAADAGHLAIQELMLRLARRTGRGRTFELPTRPAQPTYSTDIGLRDDDQRLLIQVECWNSFGSINAAIRSTRRKLAEAEALAAAVGGEQAPYRVATCWVVRDTRRNRELIARYPEVFAATFTGSSVAWVRALTAAGWRPPGEPGLV